jgi:hypothetical protein
MHKETYSAFEEEYINDPLRLPVKNKRRVSRERDGAGQQKSAPRNSQWVYGNLFECLTGNDNCMHGKIPFGGSFYCSWPLKDTSAVHRKPPCLSDLDHTREDQL